MRIPSCRGRTKGSSLPFARTYWKHESNWPGESGQPETLPATPRPIREIYEPGEAIEQSTRRAWSFRALPVVLHQNILESGFLHREVGYGKGHKKRRQRPELTRHAKNPSTGLRVYH